MHNRIRQVRMNANLSQTEFAERINLSKNFISLVENGGREPSDRTIRDICREFGVNEIWLRTGIGDPFQQSLRAQEISALVRTLLDDRPEAFRARLVTALLRFSSDAPEWEALENIYNSIEAELKKEADQ